MTDRWSAHAQAYRESEAHRSGGDLDLLVDWATGRTALDVATGGGHVSLQNVTGAISATSGSEPGVKRGRMRSQ